MNNTSRTCSENDTCSIYGPFEILHRRTRKNLTESMEILSITLFAVELISPLCTGAPESHAVRRGRGTSGSTYYCFRSLIMFFSDCSLSNGLLQKPESNLKVSKSCACRSVFLSLNLLDQSFVSSAPHLFQACGVMTFFYFRC